MTSSYLCSTIRTVFLSQPVILSVEGPVIVVGDIHGQFFDLVRIFLQNGLPPDHTYLFLGDYVDRGKRGVDVLCLLYALKIKYPNHIHLLRGNHETASMNRLYGFYDECLRRYNHLFVWNAFVSSFNVLPFAALVNESVLCVHGGISPLLERIEQLKKITRPVDIPETGLIADLVWADPDTTPGFQENSRGAGCLFGMDVLERFLKANNLKLLIRAHEMVDGFSVLNNRCITVFSAPNFCGSTENAGAFLAIAKTNEIDFYVAAPQLTRRSLARRTLNEGRLVRFPLQKPAAEIKNRLAGANWKGG